MPRSSWSFVWSARRARSFSVCSARRAWAVRLRFLEAGDLGIERLFLTREFRQARPRLLDLAFGLGAFRPKVLRARLLGSDPLVEVRAEVRRRQDGLFQAAALRFLLREFHLEPRHLVVQPVHGSLLVLQRSPRRIHLALKFVAPGGGVGEVLPDGLFPFVVAADGRFDLRDLARGAGGLFGERLLPAAQVQDLILVGEFFKITLLDLLSERGGLGANGFRLLAEPAPFRFQGGDLRGHDDELSLDGVQLALAGNDAGARQRLAADDRAGRLHALAVERDEAQAMAAVVRQVQRGGKAVHQPCPAEEIPDDRLQLGRVSDEVRGATDDAGLHKEVCIRQFRGVRSRERDQAGAAGSVGSKQRDRRARLALVRGHQVLRRVAERRLDGRRAAEVRADEVRDHASNAERDVRVVRAQQPLDSRIDVLCAQFQVLQELPARKTLGLAAARLAQARLDRFGLSLEPRSLRFSLAEERAAVSEASADLVPQAGKPLDLLLQPRALLDLLGLLAQEPRAAAEMLPPVGVHVVEFIAEGGGRFRSPGSCGSSSLRWRPRGVRARRRRHRTFRIRRG